MHFRTACVTTTNTQCNCIAITPYICFICFICSNYDGHRDCTKKAVKESCGVDAADLAEQIVVISGGDIVHMYCTNYTIHSPQCSSMISSSSLPSQSISFCPPFHVISLSLVMLRLPSAFILIFCITSCFKFT